MSLGKVGGTVGAEGSCEEVASHQGVVHTSEEAYRRKMKEERKRLKEQPSKPKEKKVLPSESEIAKDKEIMRLRLELERERTLNLALNRMIDIAESKLNIPIRKKSGAKQ